MSRYLRPTGTSEPSPRWSSGELHWLREVRSTRSLRTACDRCPRIGAIEELFDVAVIRGKTCPMAVGTQGADIQSLYGFDKKFGPLRPAGDA
ncbi:hypothetical protein TMRO357_02298 [Alteriqipengyuania sp. 357]